MINSFLINQEDIKLCEIFFNGPPHVSCLGWEIEIDMSSQCNNCLRVCNVKMKKKLPGWKWHTFPRMYGLWGPSINQFELIFSKMLKLDEKECLDLKMSDFVKFSTLACLTCFCGSITLCSFLKAILVRF